MDCLQKERRAQDQKMVTRVLTRVDVALRTFSPPEELQNSSLRLPCTTFLAPGGLADSETRFAALWPPGGEVDPQA